MAFLMMWRHLHITMLHCCAKFSIVFVIWSIRTVCAKNTKLCLNLSDLPRILWPLFPVMVYTYTVYTVDHDILLLWAGFGHTSTAELSQSAVAVRPRTQLQSCSGSLKGRSLDRFYFCCIHSGPAKVDRETLRSWRAVPLRSSRPIAELLVS